MGKFDPRSLVLPLLFLAGIWFLVGRDEAVAVADTAAVVERSEAAAAPGIGEEFAGIASRGASADAVPLVDPFLARFGSYRIRSQTRFGDIVQYSFVDGAGDRITQAQLLDEGFRVVSRSSSLGVDVLIMDGQGRYINVREFAVSLPVGEKQTDDIYAFSQ